MSSDFEPVGEKLVPGIHGETIDGGAPYEFDDAKHDPNQKDEHEDMVGEVSADPAFEEKDAIEIDGLPFEELKQARLNRKRTVMDLLDHQDNLYAYFAAVDEETGRHTSSYAMTIDDWEAFGKPEKITVGVVNGDILNN